MLINKILDRLKEHVEPKTDASLARALNVEPQNIVNWRNRGTIPAEKIYNFAIEKGLSFDWLFTGQESKKGGEDNIVEEWQMKTIIELINSKIDGQAKQIARYTDVVQKYSGQVEEVWKVINTKDINLATVRQSINDITMEIFDIRKDMNSAAESKDVSLLKKVAGD